MSLHHRTTEVADGVPDRRHLTFGTPLATSLVAVVGVAMVVMVILLGQLALGRPGPDTDLAAASGKPLGSPSISAEAAPSEIESWPPPSTTVPTDSEAETPTPAPSSPSSTPSSSQPPHPPVCCGPPDEGQPWDPSDPWTGIRWSGEFDSSFPRESTIDASARITDVTFWRDGFVAAGRVNGTSGYDAAFFASNDGEIWWLTDLVPSAGLVPDVIITTPDKVVALAVRAGGTLSYWSSSDGNTWTEMIASPFAWAEPTDVVVAAAGGDGGIVVVGASGAADSDSVGPVLVMHSLDAGGWGVAQRTPALDSATIRDIAEVPGGFAMVGGRQLDPSVGTELRPTIWTTDDGLTWSIAKLPDDLPLSSVFERIFVGTDGMGVLGRDTDGQTWRLQSTDGRSWNRAPTAGWELLDAAEWAGGDPVIVSDGTRIVAVGTYRGTARAWVSTDARAWAELEIPGTPDGMLHVDVEKQFVLARDGLLLWVDHGCCQTFTFALADRP